MIRAIRTLEESLGDARIGPIASEGVGRRDFRLSCIAVRDLSSGARLGDDDVALARPGTGLPPSAREWIVGRRLARGVPAGQPFALKDFD
jgi:sialic acid synthase SpsE